MKPLLYVTTAISLVCSAALLSGMAEARAFAPNSPSAAPRYIANSPYQARRQQQARVQPLRTSGAPMLDQTAPDMPFGKLTAAPQQPMPQPIQLASAADMGGSPLLMPADGLAAPHTLIPVLPRTVLAPSRPLYPSKVGTKPALEARVLPLPEEMAHAAPQTLLPLPAEAPMSAPAVAAAPSVASAPTILPLPDAMAKAGAPVFKPYATIEMENGTMPERSAQAVQAATPSDLHEKAVKQLQEAEAFVNALPPIEGAQNIPAAQPMSQPLPHVEAAVEPVAAPPSVLPLPDDMATAKKPEQVTAAPKHFLPVAAPASHGLSEQTKRTLAKIPSGVDAPKPEKGGHLSIKRFDPELEGLLANKDADKEEIASMEGKGVSIQVRRPSLNADAELERAYNELSGGQSEAAIETYKQVLAAYPRNESALFGVAATYHRMGKTDQARVYYEKLLNINPDHRDALNNFLVLVADESPDEALHQMQILERKNPDFSPIPAQMAIIYSKMGNADAAKSKMLQAMRLAPDNLAYQYNLAIMMDKQGRYADAAPLYRKLIAASQQGKDIPTDVGEIEHRLVYIDSIRQD